MPFDGERFAYIDFVFMEPLTMLEHLTNREAGTKEVLNE